MCRDILNLGFLDVKACRSRAANHDMKCCADLPASDLERCAAWVGYLLLATYLGWLRNDRHSPSSFTRIVPTLAHRPPSIDACHTLSHTCTQTHDYLVRAGFAACGDCKTMSRLSNSASQVGTASHAAATRMRRRVNGNGWREHLPRAKVNAVDMWGMRGTTPARNVSRKPTWHAACNATAACIPAQQPVSISQCVRSMSAALLCLCKVSRGEIAVMRRTT